MGSTRKLSMAVAAAAMLMVPAAGAAQTPPSTPPATQPPATTPAQPPAAQSNAAAQEHLAKASAALNDIKTATLSAKAKSQVAEVKRRINALERTVAANDKASPTGAAARSPRATADAKGNANWGNEVAAIDKTLTALLGPDPATPSAPPAPTGTAGAPGKGAAATAQLDEATRASLKEVRTHLTAFATAMAGGKSPDPEPAADPSAAPTSSATPASAAPPSATPPSATPPSATPPSAAPTSAAPQTPMPTGTSGTSQAQPPATSQNPSQPDDQAARRYLTEARNTLSALTQLPAASQLTGEARSQVAQLISNFNELITTQSEWRGSFAKVSANLTSLIGAEAGVPDPSSSGTPGAVGTSGAGMPNLDPTIQAKLVELRKNLSEFEKAAGGTPGAAAASTPSSATPSSATPSSATSSSATPPSATPSSATASPATPASATPPAATPPTDPPASASSSAASPAGAQAASGNPEIMRHVAAIEALLKSEDEGGGLTLTKAQVEQLRTHWAALRQALDKR